ncbi:MAG: hypothetical protein JRH20_00395 [Deltaproteobacteria bacterium]|nr:hypothetical protein [Deltaproteobacteria bacterium]
MFRGRTTTDWALTLAAIGLMLLAVRPFYGLTVDDALISFRYAQNWVEGCGPVYSCGEAPVEGYTNFLWVAIAAGFIRLGVAVIPAMQLLGLLCSMAALLVGLRLAKVLHGERLAGLALGLGLAASPFWALNSVIALETSAAALSIVSATLLSLELPRRRPFTAGLAWAISYLIRPEAMLFALLTGIYALLASLVRRDGWRLVLLGALRYSLGFLSVAGPYFLWRALYYKSLFPNTYYAKKGALKTLVPQNLELLWRHPIFWVALGAAAVFVLLWRRKGKILYVMLVGLTSAMISLSVHNNWWMPGHRLYMSAALLFLAVGGGVVTLGARAHYWAWRAPGLVLTTALLGALFVSTWRNQPSVSTEAEQHYARENHPAERMGSYLRKHAKKGDWLIIRDAGFIPFFAGPKLKVLDIHDHSLNDRRIARQGWSLNYILSRKPRFIVLASYNGRTLQLAHLSERRIHTHPDFKLYRQLMRVAWNGTRHYFLYERNPLKASSLPARKMNAIMGPPLPPHLRARQLSKTGRAKRAGRLSRSKRRERFTGVKRRAHRLTPSRKGVKPRAKPKH